MPLQLDPFKHCIRLFVDMKFDGLENNIVEISGNGCLDWYLHIAVEERAMKYPFFSYYWWCSYKIVSSNFYRDKINVSSFGIARIHPVYDVVSSTYVSSFGSVSFGIGSSCSVGGS